MPYSSMLFAADLTTLASLVNFPQYHQVNLLHAPSPTGPKNGIP